MISPPRAHEGAEEDKGKFDQRRYTLKVKLRVGAPDDTPELSAEELAKRLLRHFPSAVIDRDRGNAHVQAGLDRLIDNGAPAVIFESHRAYFGNVIYASVGESHWKGMTATSYLYRIWPPLGDTTVTFDVRGSADDATVVSIARELGVALGMVPCSDVVDADPCGESCL